MLFVNEDRDGNTRSNGKESAKLWDCIHVSKREREILRHMTLTEHGKRTHLVCHITVLAPLHTTVRDKPCIVFSPSIRLIMLPPVLPISQSFHKRKNVNLYTGVHVYVCSL